MAVLRRHLQTKPEPPEGYEATLRAAAYAVCNAVYRSGCECSRNAHDPCAPMMMAAIEADKVFDTARATPLSHVREGT